MAKYKEIVISCGGKFSIGQYENLQPFCSLHIEVDDNDDIEKVREEAYEIVIGDMRSILLDVREKMK